MPEARFARAMALARAGEVDAALKIYKALGRSKRADLRRAALYNLGNLYMREAEGAAPTDEFDARCR